MTKVSSLAADGYLPKSVHATSMSMRNYPLLDAEEFTEACHHLDSQYCRATLGPVRKQWKLRTCRALDTTFSVDGGYTTYIQIIRPLAAPDDLDLDLGAISFSEPGRHAGEDDAIMEAEQEDEVCCPCPAMYGE